MKENKRAIGAKKEKLAAGYLSGKGYRIITQNFNCPRGELDLIARSPEGILCFVEVKYRTGEEQGFPEEAVGTAKQKRIFGAAEWFMEEKGVPETEVCRFDVVAIEGEAITHLKNAFGSL